MTSMFYAVHQFKTPGNNSFVVSNALANSEVEYLIVAAGGRGGYSARNGAGGAGGLREGFLSVSNGSYSVSVAGAFPALGIPSGGWVSLAGNTLRGDSSSFAGISATGGGRLGQRASHGPATGGSGGGGSPPSYGGDAGNGTGVAGNLGGYNPPEGFKGGNGAGYYGGGGGGAGGQGNDATTSSSGAAGPGKFSSITGRNLVYAVGGRAHGGANVSHVAPDFNSANQNFIYGKGGRGAGNFPGTLGPGQQGVVIVRYPLKADTRSTDIIHAHGGRENTIEKNGILYRVHEFFSPYETVLSGISPEKDAFIVTNAPQNAEVEYLIVAGGGAGRPGDCSNLSGGGGGAGGVIQGTFTVSAETYIVQIGSGSFGNGEDSSLFGQTAVGGGRGGSISVPPIIGGSGGGGGAGAAEDRTGAAGTSGQGNPGGSTPSTGSNQASAGGGGAGGAGTSGTTSVGGNGGPGISSDITGVSKLYAAGGGGAGYGVNSPQNRGIGGSGIGGNGSFGGDGISGTNATPGKPRTGSGGGGGFRGLCDAGIGSFSHGGSGVVVIRYPIGNA